MLSIPGELLSHCRNTFLQCQEFESYRALKAVFTTTELGPLRFGLREADNTNQLVDLFLEYILRQTLFDGTPALTVFIKVLVIRHFEGTATRQELELLHQKLESIAHSQKSGNGQGGYERNKVFDMLLRLNFRSQIQTVRQIIDQQDIAAFLVHGPPDFGQRMLSYRLSHLLPGWNSGRNITIDAGSNGTGKSSRSLWREIAKRLELPTDTDIKVLAEKVCQWRKTQDVVFVIHTVDYIPPSILSNWIDCFWKPLVQMANEQNSYSSRSKHLLLFLVDYSGHVYEQCNSFVGDPQSLQNSHLPLKLPVSEKFTENELDIWLDTASEIFPIRPNVNEIINQTENGIPDFVYENICRYCGLNWEGELAP